MKLTCIWVVIVSVAAGILAGSATYDKNSNHTYKHNYLYLWIKHHTGLRLSNKDKFERKSLYEEERNYIFVCDNRMEMIYVKTCSHYR